MTDTIGRIVAILLAFGAGWGAARVWERWQLWRYYQKHGGLG